MRDEGGLVLPADGEWSLLQTQEKATGGLVTREEGCGGQQRVCNTPSKGLEYSEGDLSAFLSGIHFSVCL